MAAGNGRQRALNVGSMKSRGGWFELLAVNQGGPGEITRTVARSNADDFFREVP